MRKSGIKKDKDGWVKIEDGKPENFDLVTLLYENEWMQPAWWNGFSWESGHPLYDKKIIAWKKRHESNWN